MRFLAGIFATFAAALAVTPGLAAQGGLLGEPVGGVEVAVDSTAPAPAPEAEAEAAPKAAAKPAAEASSAGALRLVVDLGERRLYVYQGEERLRSYPVAVGKANHPTPRGEFRIQRVIWNPRWVPPRAPWARGKKAKGPGEPGNPMGRVKMYFKEPDYYIHGTSEEGSLGSAASHGCIRMANGDVVELAKLVMKHGGQPRDASWFRKVLDRVRNTQQVRLGEPVRVVIRG